MGTLFSELLQVRPPGAGAPLVYADANVPAPIVRHMRSRLGWDVTHVMDDPEWRRASDVAHYHRARALRRTLVTQDHDFFDDRRFPPADSGGVVVVSAPDSSTLMRLLDDLDALLRVSERAREDPLLPLKGRKLHLFPGWTEYA